MRFAGKVALVTGASRGIGKAIVTRLQAEGATVLMPDRTHLDVSKDADWARLPQPDVDVVVNCAGLATYSNVLDEPIFHDFEAFNVMLYGTWNGMQWAIKRMKDGGSIVNVTSIFGQRAGSGKGVFYQMAKAAVGQLTRNAAITLAPKGIRVNAVCPGFIDTAMASPFHTNEKYREFVLNGTPLNRMGNAAEVAAAVAFLASDEASFITGVELPVDGGWLAR